MGVVTMETTLANLIIETDSDDKGRKTFQLHLVVNGTQFPIGGEIKADDLLDAAHVFSRKLTRALQ
jgi:hypothetical protein